VNKVAIRARLEYTKEQLTDLIDPKDLLVLLLVIGIAVVGLGAAYLVVRGDWLIALAGVLVVPVVVLIHRFPFMALLIWMILSPFLVQTPTSAERQVFWLIHRFLPVITLAIIAIVSLLGISRRHLPRLTLAEFGMFGYLVVSVISIILESPDAVQTMIRFYDLVFIPMCLYMVIRFSAPGNQRLKRLLPIAVFIIVTQVAVGVLSWIAPSLLPSEWLTYAGARTTGSLNSVSVFSTTLIFAGVFVFYSAREMKEGWRRNVLLLLYLASIYAIFISFSRASWLAGFLVFAGVVALYPRFMFRFMLVAIPITLLAAGTLFVNQLQFAEQRLYSQESSQTALSRLPVIVAAYRMFEEKPIIGWGYDNFDRYDRTFQTRFGELVNPDEKDLTSHNTYLTILAEQGLVGLGFYLLPVIWLMFRTIKDRARLPQSGYMSARMVGLLWLVILSYFIVNNLAPMVVVFGTGLYWITLGLIANALGRYAPIK
jgi:O-antigen ligase